jgi:hypothetical protein
MRQFSDQKKKDEAVIIQVEYTMNDEIKLHPIISYRESTQKSQQNKFSQNWDKFHSNLSFIPFSSYRADNYKFLLCLFFLFFFLLYNYFQYGGKSGFSVSPKEQRGAYNTNR